MLIRQASNDDAYARVERDMQHMASVGNIDVDVWRMGEGQKVAWRNASQKHMINKGLAEVHEKALKGEPKYHGVS